MRYLNLKDSERIEKGLEELKKQLMEFSKPEDLKPFLKMIKKTIPWYRRRDFYSFMTYVVLANSSLTNANRQQNVGGTVVNNGANVVRQPQQRPIESLSPYVMWTNYSPRNVDMLNEFKKFILQRSGLDASCIVGIAPKRFCSFVAFKDEASMKKSIEAVNNQSFDKRLIKANLNNSNK